VDKNVNYGTVETNLTVTINAGLPKNLGSDRQALSATDGTILSRLVLRHLIESKDINMMAPIVYLTLLG
jgi:hypothetical protein